MFNFQGIDNRNQSAMSMAETISSALMTVPLQMEMGS